MNENNTNVMEEMNPYQEVVEEKNSIYDKKMKENFHVFGVASIIFAILYAFCMYKNPSGITHVLFVLGEIAYIIFCIRKMELELKKGSWFYLGAMILLSISTFCTDDGRIIALNKTGLFLLTISFVLGLFYDTGKWGLGKYLGTIIGSCFMAVGQIYTPFRDALWYVKNKLDKKNNKYLYILLGFVIAIPIFAIVFLLLRSADLVFRDMAEKVLKNMNVGDVFLIALLIIFMTMVGYCLMTLLAKDLVKEEVKEGKKWEPLVGIPVVLFLSLLYLVFSVIQILYLFIGNMQLPKEYTYAEYAREGFFQLLAVAILNLIIVLICLSRFKSNKFLKGLLVIMSLCTFIMIASSGLRMMIYIQYYYLTFLRILVLWALIVLTILFVGVIIATIKGNFPLFRYSIVVVTCFYLCLSFSHPDYWIAKVNLEGAKETRSEFFKGEPYEDYYFLTYLSADAAPIMVDWVKDNGYDLNYYYEDYEEEGMRDEWDDMRGYRYIHNLRDRVGDVGIRNFNVSRYLADKKVESSIGK